MAASCPLPLTPHGITKVLPSPKSLLTIPLWQWSTSGAPLGQAVVQEGAPSQQCLLGSECRVAGACRPAAAARGLFSHILIQMLILWTPL